MSATGNKPVFLCILQSLLIAAVSPQMQAESAESAVFYIYIQSPIFDPKPQPARLRGFRSLIEVSFGEMPFAQRLSGSPESDTAFISSTARLIRRW